MIRFVLTAVVAVFVVASNAWAHGDSHAGPATLDPQLKGSGPDLHLYRESSCRCCTKWGNAMAASGFNVIDHVKDNLDSLKQSEGVPSELASCHTAFVEGYVLEGHVPVQSVKRLLREMPEITGLAVPGMPLGSPGMEAPNVEGDRYDVIALQNKGTPTIYESYKGLTLR